MRHFVLAGTAAAIALALAPHDAPAQPSPEPMIFAVAKGEPDSCGPGCSEWIAVEGNFDGPEVEQRFRKLLATIKDRKLPIVFNSLGGVIGEALVLGRILRERRMMASVGETYPEGCRARITADESCRRILQSNREVKARLRTAGATCFSACAYAFLGASARQVPPEASLGIHASRPTPESLRPGAPTAEQIHNGRKRYVLEMGVDPRLVDAAAKISSQSIHKLTRDEIAQFGIETRGAYETAWTPYEDARVAKGPYMIKSITHARGISGNEYRTTNIRMTCDATRSGTHLQYQREPASNEIGVPTVIRAAAGSDVRTLQRGDTRRADDFYSVIADRQFFQKAIAMGSIVFTETFSPRNARAWSRDVKLSTAGLESALQTSLKNCGGR